VLFKDVGDFVDQVESLVGEIREELFYKKFFIEEHLILKRFGP
jgi:hypothetical protein